MKHAPALEAIDVAIGVCIREIMTVDKQLKFHEEQVVKNRARLGKALFDKTALNASRQMLFNMED